jgi:hypothetical protein
VVLTANYFYIDKRYRLVAIALLILFSGLVWFGNDKRDLIFFIGNFLISPDVSSSISWRGLVHQSSVANFCSLFISSYALWGIFSHCGFL